jgi:hypothetical protein
MCLVLGASWALAAATARADLIVAAGTQADLEAGGPVAADPPSYQAVAAWGGVTQPGPLSSDTITVGPESAPGGAIATTLDVAWEGPPITGPGPGPIGPLILGPRIVPEPASLVLMTLGALGLVGYSRRRARIAR